jgi:hypothetical protein
MNRPRALSETRVEAPVDLRNSPERTEGRQHVVHVVEYNRYPRRDPSEDRRVAYTQDRSPTGMGLDLPEAVAPGELLKVTLHDIDGDIDLEGLARVVWCETLSCGRARAGIAILREEGERPLLRVRRSRAKARIWKILEPGSR